MNNSWAINGNSCEKRKECRIIVVPLHPETLNNENYGSKNDTSVYLTPEGFKFVIQMQLHKSLKLMNYLNIN